MLTSDEKLIDEKLIKKTKDFLNYYNNKYSENLFLSDYYFDNKCFLSLSFDKKSINNDFSLLENKNYCSYVSNNKKYLLNFGNSPDHVVEEYLNYILSSKDLSNQEILIFKSRIFSLISLSVIQRYFNTWKKFKSLLMIKKHKNFFFNKKDRSGDTVDKNYFSNLLKFIYSFNKNEDFDKCCRFFFTEYQKHFNNNIAKQDIKVNNSYFHQFFPEEWFVKDSYIGDYSTTLTVTIYGKKVYQNSKFQKSLGEYMSLLTKYFLYLSENLPENLYFNKFYCQRIKNNFYLTFETKNEISQIEIEKFIKYLIENFTYNYSKDYFKSLFKQYFINKNLNNFIKPNKINKI